MNSKLSLRSQLIFTYVGKACKNGRCRKCASVHAEISEKNVRLETKGGKERHTRRTKGGRWTKASDLSASADLMQLDHANFSVLRSRLPVTCRMVEETWSGVLPCRHRARMLCTLYPTRPRIRAVHRHCYYGRLPQSGASKQLRK